LKGIDGKSDNFEYKFEANILSNIELIKRWYRKYHCGFTEFKV